MPDQDMANFGGARLVKSLKDRLSDLLKQQTAHKKAQESTDPEEWAAEELNLDAQLTACKHDLAEYTKAYLTAFSSSHATAGLPNNIQ